MTLTKSYIFSKKSDHQLIQSDLMFSRKGAEQVKKNVSSWIQCLVFMCKMMFKQHSKKLHTNSQRSWINCFEVNAISASPCKIIFIPVQQPGSWLLEVQQGTRMIAGLSGEESKIKLFHISWWNTNLQLVL